VSGIVLWFMESGQQTVNVTELEEAQEIALGLTGGVPLEELAYTEPRGNGQGIALIGAGWYDFGHHFDEPRWGALVAVKGL
jgi:hypothetical protein